MSEVCIIGGGASGLMAALTALSDPRNRVTLLERQGRVGRKLLSTGNGRCNLSNRHASPVHYHGADPDFCRPALEAFPVAETLRFFHQLGLVTVEEPDGKLYPRSNTANSVLDVLRLALEGQPDRLTLRTGDPVTSLKCRGQGFTVTLESGEVLRGMDCVILAAGGAAGSKVGGVLDGYRLAKGLGHHRTALTPALVQLKTDPTYPRSLKGVKTTARITLRRGREVLAENHGEILFTEYGVSGPAIFEISRYAIGEDVTLSLDLWPEQSEADTAAWLRRRQALALRNRELTCGQAFTGALHSRLSQMAAKYAETIDAVEGTVPRENGEVSIASYMNFLIVNGGVILPQYGDENDALAVRQVQEMFPDREVVGVQTREVAFGGGNIHCITQQQPRP